MAITDIAKAASDHDGLVVPVAEGRVLPVGGNLKSAKVSRNIWPAELVIE